LEQQSLGKENLLSRHGEAVTPKVTVGPTSRAKKFRGDLKGRKKRHRLRGHVEFRKNSREGNKGEEDQKKATTREKKRNDVCK